MADGIRVAQRTPGPWKVDPYRETDTYTWVTDADGRPIAGTAGRMTIADAHLTAAALELLEQCNAALAALTNPEAFDIEQVRANIRAAIIKAEPVS